MKRNIKRLSLAALMMSSSVLVSCRGMKRYNPFASSKDEDSSSYNSSIPSTTTSYDTSVSSYVPSTTTTTNKESNTSTSEDTRKTYYITYILDGGTNNSLNPSSFKEDEEIELFAPSKEGYDFMGWFEDENFQSKITKIDYGMNYNLYAKFEVHNFTITYHNVEGLVNNSPKEFTIENSIIALDSVSKDYYDFEGWKLSPTSEELITSYTIEEYKDLDFYASFNAITYSITYEGVDGLTNLNPTTYTYEDNITLQEVEKKDNKFIGWYDEDDKLVTKIVNRGGNLVLHAKFSSTLASYKVEHYLEELDGTYKKITEDTEEKVGTIGENASYTLNKYTGFNALEVTPVTILEDGTSVLEIYYQRVVSQLTIAYGSGVNKITESKKLKFGESIALNVELEEGYEFVSWNNGKDVYASTQEATFEMGITPVTLTCVTSPITYTISYELNGGIGTNETSYNIESDTIKLTNPTKEGYTFTGWTSAELGITNQKDVSIPTGTTGDINLSANYEVNSYTISFNSNGGTAVESVSFDYGEEVVLPSSPTREGYEFVSWNKTIKTMPAHNEELVAQWSVVDYTITYYSYGGNNLNTVTSYNIESDKIDLLDASKAGYDFKGWYLESTFENKVTSILTGTTGNISLYAKFESSGNTAYKVEHYQEQLDGSYLLVDTKNETGETDTDTNAVTITLTGYTPKDYSQVNINGDGSTVVKIYYDRAQIEYTFKLNNGEEDIVLSGKYLDEVSSVSNPTKEGHKFISWNQEIPSTFGATDLVFEANYSINEYSIKFDTKGGTSLEPVVLEYGSKVPTLSTPTREGYKFTGWAETVPTKMPANDVTLTATWEAISYTVSFNTNGGSKIDPISVKYGEQVNLPTSPTREGYKFGGWDKTLTTMPANNVELVAQWDIVDYKITYNLNGGSATNVNSYNVETESFTLNNPTKEGYTFTGWTSVELGITNVKNVSISKGTTGDITLTAEYSAISYTLSFNTNGGTSIASQSYNYGDTIVLPDNPTKAGYKFTGWNLNITTMPSNDVELVASWEIEEYSITYTLDGGTASNPTKYNVESDSISLNNPTKEGYNFTGWTSVELGITKQKNVTIPSGTTGDIKLTATWEVQKYTITFNTNGGTPIETQEVAYGTKLSLPANPTRVGYTFDGWDKDLPSTMPASNIVLNAKWSLDEHTITYKYLKNNVEFSGPTTTNATTITYEDSLVLTNATYSGMNFAGWYLDVACTKPVTTLSKVTGDLTLYGSFTSNAVLNLVVEDATFTYDGTAKSVKYHLTSGGSEVELPAGCTLTLDYGVENPTDAGTYDVVATFSDSSSTYQLTSSSKTTAKLTIEKMEIELSNSLVEASFDSSIRTVDQVKSSYLSSLEFKNASTGEAIEGISNYSVKNMTNGVTTYTSSTTTNVSGSTYLVTLNFDETNYKLKDNQFIFKYKTVYLTSDSSTFYTIEDAIEKSGTIMLAGDSTSATTFVTTEFCKLQSSEKNPYTKTTYTISGTLVVPHKADTRSDWSTPVVNSKGSSSYVYSALKIPSNVTLNVKGTFVVDGEIKVNAIPTLRGVVINEGQINLSNGANLYSFGYLKGTGKVEQASGSNIVDCFRNFDYPGGNTASKVYQKTLPMNAWSFHNNSCETKIYAGANYYAFFYQSPSSTDVTAKACIVGTSSSIFKMADGYIIKKTTDSKNGSAKINQTSITASTQTQGVRDVLEIHGTCVDQQFSISMGVSVKTSTSISACFGYIDVTLSTGSSLTLSNSDYIFLPGCELTIEEGATLTTNSGVDLIFETWDNVNDSSINSSTSYAFAQKCVDKVDAKMTNNGTFICKGNIGGLITSTVVGATLNLSSATLSSSYYSIYMAYGASESGGYVGYQVTNFQPRGYINGEDELKVFTKSIYTSALSNEKYSWSGEDGTTSSSMNGSLNASAIKVSGGCFTGETIITMADGTTKLAKDIEIGDKVLTYNENTNEFEAKSVTYSWNHGDNYYGVVKSMFSNGAIFESIQTHDMYDVTLGEYVEVTESNVESYVGHQFLSYDDGIITLVGYEIDYRYTGCYSFITEGNFSAVTNGIVTRTPEFYPGTFDFFRLVESNSDEFKELIDQLGTYEYDVFKDYISYDLYEAFHLRYATIVVATGIITFEDLLLNLSKCA